METTKEDEILEGFLCPICMADLRSPSQLRRHFERAHQEEELRRFGPAQEGQLIGVSRSSTDYFMRVRFDRLDRYDTETNKLLIRLDKLICNMPTDSYQRKQHEMEAVPWLDGTSVRLCPNCAKAFSITRRKHHCRLCGSILCHDCSVFLDLNIARTIVDPSAPQPTQTDNESLEKTGLRLCEHCSNLIELRRQVQESRNAKTSFMTAYEQMRSLMEQATPKVAMYEKMCQSLSDGETIYNISDANALRGMIGKLAEGIDQVSEQILLAAADPGSRQAKVQNCIRQAATQFIKEDLLSLRKLPTEAEIEEARKIKLEKVQRRLSWERKQREMEAVEESSRRSQTQAGPSARIDDDDDNPLLEQMNIVRGYIKDARDGGRFDEVASLERHLQELKNEYHLQKLSKI